jgi:hypothetical protein
MACVLVLGACGGKDVSPETTPEETTAPQETGDRPVVERTLTLKEGVTLNGPECGWENRTCPDSLSCYLLHLDNSGNTRGVCLVDDDQKVCAMFTCASGGKCQMRESLPPQVMCGG